MNTIKKGTTNKSNLAKHQKGQSRKLKESGNEKGDIRRPIDRSNKKHVNHFENIAEVAPVIAAGVATVAVVYLVANNATLVGIVDDFLIPSLLPYAWDIGSQVLIGG